MSKYEGMFGKRIVFETSPYFIKKEMRSLYGGGTL